MFKNILVPISSDYFPEMAIRRSKTLAEKFKGKVHFLYVVEKKTVEQMEKTGTHVLTPKLISELENDIYHTQVRNISRTVLDRTKTLMGPLDGRCNYLVRKGEFSDEIEGYLKENSESFNHITCVILEYKKHSNLKYRIFENCSVPIWLERGGKIEKVFAATTSISKNKLVPSYAKQIAVSYNAVLTLKHFSVHEDDENENEIKLQKDWKGVSNVEKDIVRRAEEENTDLLIIGRTCKACGFFGFGTHFPKVVIAKKATMSVLIMYS